MAGREGVGKGRPLFSQVAYRELYLSKLREGFGRVESAKLVGVKYSTVWRYLQDHPEYLLEIKDAEGEQVESSFKLWRQIMNDPAADPKDRLRASENIAKYRAREQGRDDKVLVEHKHTLEISGGDQTNKILELERQLDERLGLPSGILEGHVVEDDEEEEP